MTDLLGKVRARLFGSGLLRNVRGASHPRRALLLNLVAAFGAARRSRAHQHIGQAQELAWALDEWGYTVDVADWHERRPILGDAVYDLVVDLHPAEPALYDGHLARDAVRLSYLTGSNPAVSNAAERARLEDLRLRRGVVLAPRRQVAPLPRERFESFDGVLTFAGETALRTYGGFRLPPIHHLVNNGYEDLAPTDPALRDPRRFLFMGSVGQVHKGLDLLLEAFSAEPGIELTVLSRFRRERDFAAAYRRELQLQNIHAVGFLDVASQTFREIQSRCGWLVLPSCAEAQCGTISVAMSVGIPVVASEACDFDEPEIIRLPDCRIQTIRDTLRDLAARPAAEVRGRSEAAAALVRRNYTRAAYAGSLRAALRSLLGREET